MKRIQKPFDFKRFCDDFGVRYSSGSKNASPGWIQTQCAFCDDRSDHLGYNTYGGFLSCWRCGFHSNLQFVQAVTGTNWNAAKLVLQSYLTGHFKRETLAVKHVTATHIDLNFALPLSENQRMYLAQRNFDPAQLVETWHLRGTGPTGDYKHRIIIPITYNNKLVSYQGRDFTGKAHLRYKACKKEKEVIHHKHLLYGLDQCEQSQCIVVEGVTDAWRFGPGAVATFGVKYTKEQMFLLAENFQRVFIMYDEGTEAQVMAERLGNGLVMLGVQTDRCVIKGDPGSLPQEVADTYKRELFGRR